MSWDLIGELRQLANDLVTVSPQTNAIKGKHPAILDAAARRLRELEDEVKKLRHENNQLREDWQALFDSRPHTT